MKIPFTLDAWLKDKSQKVVDEDGRPVRIICTDADGLYPIIGLVDNKTPLPCGKDGRPPYIGGGGGSLFFITPEPELSEFEKELSRCLCDSNVRPEEEDYDKWAKEYAPALLNIARKELVEEQYTSDPRKTDLYKLGKAEALKDLPRWKKCEHEMHTLTHLLIRSIDAMWIGAYVKEGQYYIPTNDLILKLPGFNE